MNTLRPTYPPSSAQMPMAYDLSSDPQEIWNLSATVQTNGWMLLPLYREVAKYEASVKKYPTIKPGQDFTSYPKP